jgi:hypothetical protein
LRWLREHPAIGTALAVIAALALAVLIVLAVAADLSTAGSLPTTEASLDASNAIGRGLITILQPEAHLFPMLLQPLVAA